MKDVLKRLVDEPGKLCTSCSEASARLVQEMLVARKQHLPQECARELEV